MEAVCFLCQDFKANVGHETINCPESECKNCGQHGHFRINCKFKSMITPWFKAKNAKRFVFTRFPTYSWIILHSSPRRLAGEKKVPAIIIKQQFGFPISTTKNPEFYKIWSRAFWVIAILRFFPYVARVNFKGLISK